MSGRGGDHERMGDHVEDCRPQHLWVVPIVRITRPPTPTDPSVLIRQSLCFRQGFGFHAQQDRERGPGFRLDRDTRRADRLFCRSGARMMVATSTSSGIAGNAAGPFATAIIRTGRPRRSSRSIGEPLAQIASNCGSEIGISRRPVLASPRPALCAFRKSINDQRSSLDNCSPKAGIVTAPDGAFMPCEMYQTDRRRCDSKNVPPSNWPAPPVAILRLVRRLAPRGRDKWRSVSRTVTHRGQWNYRQTLLARRRTSSDMHRSTGANRASDPTASLQQSAPTVTPKGPHAGPG